MKEKRSTGVFHGLLSKKGSQKENSLSGALFHIKKIRLGDGERRLFRCVGVKITLDQDHRGSLISTATGEIRKGA